MSNAEIRERIARSERGLLDLARIPSISRVCKRKIANSEGRIKHILIGWRKCGEDAFLRFREYSSDAEFDQDARDLYAKGADVIYAVHA